MTPQEIERAAELLDAARSNAHLVKGLDAALQPKTFDDAFAIQAALTRRRGGVAGWKIAGVSPEQRKTLGLPQPVASPVFADFVRTSPAKFDPKRFISPALEGEFAYLLGRDLPPRSTPYTEADVLGAVSAIMPGIEITDQRVEKGVSMITRLADCFGSGAYVRGPICADWKALDILTQMAIVRLDGKEIGRGPGSTIPGGGPVNALLQIANHQPAGSPGLRAGQFVTTGTCTGQIPVGNGREVVGDFGRLGEVLLSFTA